MFSCCFICSQLVSPLYDFALVSISRIFKAIVSPLMLPFVRMLLQVKLCEESPFASQLPVIVAPFGVVAVNVLSRNSMLYILSFAYLCTLPSFMYVSFHVRSLKMAFMSSSPTHDMAAKGNVSANITLIICLAMCLIVLSVYRCGQMVFMPSRSSNGSILGSRPVKRLYRVIGCSLSPFERMLSRNDCATFMSSTPCSLKME